MDSNTTFLCSFLQIREFPSSISFYCIYLKVHSFLSFLTFCSIFKSYMVFNLSSRSKNELLFILYLIQFCFINNVIIQVCWLSYYPPFSLNICLFIRIISVGVCFDRSILFQNIGIFNAYCIFCVIIIITVRSIRSTYTTSFFYYLFYKSPSFPLLLDSFSFHSCFSSSTNFTSLMIKIVLEI